MGQLSHISHLNWVKKQNRKTKILTILSGLFFVLPCIESYQKVDLRTITLDVPPQEVSIVYGGDNVLNHFKCSMSSCLWVWVCVCFGCFDALSSVIRIYKKREAHCTKKTSQKLNITRRKLFDILLYNKLLSLIYSSAPVYNVKESTALQMLFYFFVAVTARPECCTRVGGGVNYYWHSRHCLHPIITKNRIAFWADFLTQLRGRLEL